MFKNDKHQYEKYLLGQMSHREAHAFERLVLNDAFEQGALDGFEATDSLKALKEINKLQKKIKIKAKGGFDWMKIAAVVAVLILMGSVAFWAFLWPLDPEGQITKMAVEKHRQIAENQFDKPNLIEYEADTLNEDSISRLTASFQEPYWNGIQGNVPARSISNPVSKAIGSPRKNEIVPIEIPILQTTSGEPSFGEVSLGKNFTDTLNKGSIDLSGNYSKTTTAASSLNNHNASPSDNALVSSEDVGAGKSNLTKSTDVSFDEAVAVRDAQPVIGNDAYRSYLKNRLRYPDRARENLIEGKVRLKLTISSNGEVSDVKVKKSLGFGCDEEAIRLIREGPDWLPQVKNGDTKNSTVSIEVEFAL